MGYESKVYVCSKVQLSLQIMNNIECQYQFLQIHTKIPIHLTQILSAKQTAQTITET